MSLNDMSGLSVTHMELAREKDMYVHMQMAMELFWHKHKNVQADVETEKNATNLMSCLGFATV